MNMSDKDILTLVETLMKVRTDHEVSKVASCNLLMKRIDSLVARLLVQLAIHSGRTSSAKHIMKASHEYALDSLCSDSLACEAAVLLKEIDKRMSKCT